MTLSASGIAGIFSSIALVCTGVLREEVVSVGATRLAHDRVAVSVHDFDQRVWRTVQSCEAIRYMGREGLSDMVEADANRAFNRMVSNEDRRTDFQANVAQLSGAAVNQAAQICGVSPRLY